MLSRKPAVYVALGLVLLLVTVMARFTSADDSRASSAVGVIAFKRGHEIRLVNSDGTNDRQLWKAPLPDATFRGIRGLQWRPDGAALAFASDYQQLCSTYESDIYTINAAGGDLKRLTNSPLCAGLADFSKGTVKIEVENQTTESQFLIFVEGAPTAELITINPGAAVVVTFSGVADLGNIQQQVVLINGRKRWYDPAVFADIKAGQTVSASTRFVLTGTNVYSNFGATYPSWHRTGTKVGFLFYEGLLTQIGANPPISGGDSLILGQNAGVIADSLAWSPASDWILYSSSDHISLVQPGASDGGTPLINKEAYELVLGLDWMPDESGFVFAITGGQFGEENSNIYAYEFDPDGDKLTPLTDFIDEFAGGLTISPNGQKIVFEFADDPGDPPQLWIMNIDGSGRKPLGIQGEMPDWRPGTGINYNHHVFLPMNIR